MTPQGELFSKSTLTLTPSILVKLKDEFSRAEPNAKSTAHALGDYYVIKEHIQGPGWQQITLISGVYLKDMALMPFFKELTWSLLSLVFMAIILLNVLRINLAKAYRPLR
ncbi:hypothetical protein P4S55_01280 [Shewanella sp. PP-Sp27a-2]